MEKKYYSLVMDEQEFKEVRKLIELTYAVNSDQCHMRDKWVDKMDNLRGMSEIF